MFLTKVGKDNDITQTHISFELMADDYLLVSVDNSVNDLRGFFSYWRILMKGGNPPLEVGINNETGLIKNVTFFVDPNCFENFRFTVGDTSVGNILVDTSMFTKPYDFVDIIGGYSVSQVDNSFICKFSKDQSVKESIVNGRIEFFINDENQLVGFAINNLTESELKIITGLSKQAL